MDFSQNKTYYWQGQDFPFAVFLAVFALPAADFLTSFLLIIPGPFGGVIAPGFIGVFPGPMVMVFFILVLGLYRQRLLWQGRPGA